MNLHKGASELSKDFLGGSDSKEYACNVGDLVLISGLGRSPGGRHGSPLQYSYLENLMDRGAWQTMVHGVAKSRLRKNPSDPYICDPLQWNFASPFIQR